MSSNIAFPSYRCLAAMLLLPAASSHAHHPVGGSPETILQRFLSELGHPVIGVDHLTFVLGIGLAQKDLV